MEGPLGCLSLPLPPHLTVTVDETGTKAKVRPDDPFERRQRALWGATRARLQNHVTGVSEGHVAILRLVGVGYRASIEGGGRTVNLKVQYAHAIELPVPEGVTATTPQPTRILLHGADKAVVMQFAAQIREWRKPEPYKGKVCCCPSPQGGRGGGRLTGLPTVGHLCQQRDHPVEAEEDQVVELSGGRICIIFRCCSTYSHVGQRKEYVSWTGVDMHPDSQIQKPNKRLSIHTALAATSRLRAFLSARARRQTGRPPGQRQPPGISARRRPC